jgi:hypothetical protein
MEVSHDEMSSPIARFPVTTTDDSSDVAVALEVAAALWEKGDGQEAIRWLKRAVDAAGEAGDEARAVSLAQAVSDLEAAPAAPPVVATGPEPAASEEPVAATEPTAGDAEVVAPAEVAAPAEVVALPEFVPPVEPPAAGEPVPVAEPAPPSGSAPAPAWEGGTRVSVKISARDPTLFLLRPLPEGQPSPPGTREGFLVLADAVPSSGPRPVEADGARKPNGGGAQ